jgi:hypothetical protein
LRNAIKDRGCELDRIVEALAEALARLGGGAPVLSTMRALVAVATAR